MITYWFRLEQMSAGSDRDWLDDRAAERRQADARNLIGCFLMTTRNGDCQNSLFHFKYWWFKPNDTNGTSSDCGPPASCHLIWFHLVVKSPIFRMRLTAFYVRDSQCSVNLVGSERKKHSRKIPNRILMIKIKTVKFLIRKQRSVPNSRNSSKLNHNLFINFF